MSLPNPNPKPKPPPGNLNVKKFAESRSRELESLHAVISDRLNHDFRIHRGKRRRTTGYRSSKHKIRKVSGSGACSDSGPKTSRRVRRRLEFRSNPESGFVRSGDGTRRLRTHLWHAKRFEMVKRWGFYLPLGVQGRGRGSRAVLKWLKCGALVHDASYCHPIQMEGPEESILAIWRMILLPCPSSISEEISHSVKYGVCYNNAMLHHVGTPHSQFIAPVFYMWRPFANGNNYSTAEHDPISVGGSTSYRQLWLWIHAAAFEEGFSALRTACQKQMQESGVSVCCFSLEGHIAKLDIMGSKATQILQKILQPVSEMRSGSDHYPSTRSYLTGCTASQPQKPFCLRQADHLPPHAVLSLIVRDLRDLPPKEAEVDLEPTTHEGDLMGEDIQISGPIISRAPAQDEDSILGLWSKPETNGNFLSDSRYMWDSSEKLNPPLPENIICMDRHRKRIKHFNLDPVDDEKSAPGARDGFSQSCPILLLKHANKGNLNYGWSIVLPLNWVKTFWISLVSHRAHAIGLRERRWIACDSGLPCFPYDFPDCKAYSLLMADEAAAVENSAEHRPPAVRPSRIPIPPPWECLESTCKQGLGTNSSIKISAVQSCGGVDLASSSFDLGSQNPNSSSSKQSNTLSNGFVPRYSDALSKHLEKMPAERGLCLVRVLVRAYKEGVFEDGAVVCAPIPTDLLRWESRLEEVDKLQIPQSLVKSYFTQQDSGKWELQPPVNCSNPESYRWPIGFVTTGFVRGSKKPTAVAFCEAKLLALLREQQTEQNEARPEICVLVRNLRSAAYRRAFATVVLDDDREIPSSCKPFALLSSEFRSENNFGLPSTVFNSDYPSNNHASGLSVQGQWIFISPSNYCRAIHGFETNTSRTPFFKNHNL